MEDLLLKALGDVLVRSPHNDDEEAIMAYFESLGETSRGFFHPHPFDRNHARIICSELDENTYRLVAECGERIIGYAWFGPATDVTNYPTVGIGISDDYQGRGLGAALMVALSGEARIRGYTGLSLTVYKSNLRALRLYESCGYKVVGEMGEQHIMDLLFDECK